MNDPFLNLKRPPRVVRNVTPTKGGHGERKHSKFAASASERWFNCPGSVELSEGLPDKSSKWAEEGEKAHEVLEDVLTYFISKSDGNYSFGHNIPSEMRIHALGAADFIYQKHLELVGSELLVETRIYLSFIHPEMFGTFDAAIIDFYDTLHVFDYKYGAGHNVPVKDNLQMLFYAIGLAHRYGWDFKKVRMWIIQPRIRGYDGPTFWEISRTELKSYVPLFRVKVENVLRFPNEFNEGPWCWWCRAKSICPLKRKKKEDEANLLFGKNQVKT